ncbi:PTS sugar transporter subunit IIA [Cohnella soli]|uniref:PTS glucose transporter subunit IIA n=1 Tax=Cohnella soli TaxID=425005 RepID=A0ABW0HXQ9_9BACL
MIRRWLGRKQNASYVAASAPVNGRLIPLREVQDDAFSRGFMGKGVAIDPLDGKVASPVDGKVIHVIDTKHAVVIEHSSGVQFLIHIGIDTVDLKGEGFKVPVKAGDAISEGQVIMEFDLCNIRKAGYPTYILVIAIEEQLVNDIECEYREVRLAEPNVFRVVLK